MVPAPYPDFCLAVAPTNALVIISSSSSLDFDQAQSSSW